MSELEGSHHDGKTAVMWKASHLWTCLKNWHTFLSKATYSKLHGIQFVSVLFLVKKNLTLVLLDFP